MKTTSDYGRFSTSKLVRTRAWLNNHYFSIVSFNPLNFFIFKDYNYPRFAAAGRKFFFFNKNT
jgi:hypothetical protein